MNQAAITRRSKPRRSEQSRSERANNQFRHFACPDGNERWQHPWPIRCGALHSSGRLPQCPASNGSALWSSLRLDEPENRSLSLRADWINASAEESFVDV